MADPRVLDKNRASGVDFKSEDEIEKKDGSDVLSKDNPETEPEPETVKASKGDDTEIVFTDPRTGKTHGPMPRADWADYERENEL